MNQVQIPVQIPAALLIEVDTPTNWQAGTGKGNLTIDIEIH